MNFLIYLIVINSSFLNLCLLYLLYGILISQSFFYLPYCCCPFIMSVIFLFLSSLFFLEDASILAFVYVFFLLQSNFRTFECAFENLVFISRACCCKSKQESFGTNTVAICVISRKPLNSYLLQTFPYKQKLKL